MKIINKPLLDAFRASHRSCEWCGKPGPIEVHHLQSRGFGGGTRLDISINLFAFGHAYTCNHHGAYHAATLGTFGNREYVDEVIRSKVAYREKVTVEYIESEIARINRLDKDSPRCGKCSGKGKYAGYPLLGDGSCPECERAR